MGNKSKIDYIELNQDRIGLCYTPMNHRKGLNGHFFLDNGAFHYYTKNKEFIMSPFISLLKKHPTYDFAILPDIVKGGMKSLELSKHWLEWLPNHKWYLSVQDGMTIRDIKYFEDKIQGIFVGGSKEWKLQTMESWINHAHDLNLKCHIGRFGTLRKMIYAKQLGADSVDSSNASKSWTAWYRLIEFLDGKYDNYHLDISEVNKIGMV